MGTDVIAPAALQPPKQATWPRRSAADIATTSRRRRRKVSGRRPASGSSYSSATAGDRQGPWRDRRSSALLDDPAARRQKLRLTILVHRRVPQIHLRDFPDQNRATINPHQQGSLALHDSFCRSIIFTVIRDHKSRRIAFADFQIIPQISLREINIKCVRLADNP